MGNSPEFGKALLDELLISQSIDPGEFYEALARLHEHGMKSDPVVRNPKVVVDYNGTLAVIVEYMGGKDVRAIADERDFAAATTVIVDVAVGTGIDFYAPSPSVHTPHTVTRKVGDITILDRFQLAW